MNNTHSIEREPSKFIEAVSGGWPKIISNLKSLLEILLGLGVMDLRVTAAITAERLAPAGERIARAAGLG